MEFLEINKKVMKNRLIKIMQKKIQIQKWIIVKIYKKIN